MNFTIVTAVTPDYEEKLRAVITTWKRKQQFKDKPFLLITNGFEEPNERFKDIWPNIKIISWNLKAAENQRENILSSFILAVPDNITTEYYCKIDCDVIFTTDEDVFEEKDFEYDISSCRWGYSFTKDLLLIKEWVKNKEIPGICPLEKIPLVCNTRTTGHKRFASYVCLHKTDFVKEVINIIGKDRLPCPSHDTTLWYFVERLPGKKYRRRILKNKGIVVKKYLNSILSVIKNV
jgi:hypothetical protein